MRRSGDGGDRWVWLYGDEFGLFYDNNRSFVLSTAPGSGDNQVFGLPQGVTLIDGEWHHLVVTYDGDDSDPLNPSGTLRLYFDSLLVGSRVVTGGVATMVDQGLRLGQYAGAYDEFAVYGRVLSSLEVTEHFSVGLSTAGAACATAPTDGYGLSVLDENPALYWRLDPTVNPRVALDTSGNCRNGAYDTGSTSPTPGALLSFPDGAVASASGDALAVISGIDGLPAGNTARTIETWMRRSGDGGDQWLWLYGNEFGLFYDNNRSFVLSTATGTSDNHTIGLPAGVSLLDGAWHHVAVTYDSGALRLYFDGALLGTFTGVTVATTLDQGLYLGDYVGAYDEFAIYPHALTDIELSHHFSIGATPDGVACDVTAPTDPYGMLVMGDGPVAYHRLGDRFAPDTIARVALDTSTSCVSAAYTGSTTPTDGAL